MAHFQVILCIALFSWQGLAQSTAPTPAVSATIDIVRVVRLLDGNTLTKRTSGRYYRDQQQRTRTELDDRVMIFDPVSEKAITLDTAKRTARVVDLSSRPDRRLSVSGPDGSQTPGAASDLGTETIEGYRTKGKEYVSIVPVSAELGNAKPIRRINRLWYSEELLLPLLNIIEDPLAGNTTTRYQNLTVGPNPSLDLFQVPPGFEVSQAVWQPKQSGPSGTRRSSNPHRPGQ